MVRRDPRTGKFVSGGSGRDWADLTRVGGIINMTIPAADLAGGVRTEPVNGEEAELIDFTPMLENDEVFETVAATVSASLILPTSATAEGNAMLSFELGAESGTPGELMNQDPTFYGGVETASDGVVDINKASREIGSSWFAGRLVAESSFRDTTTGTGGGGAPANLAESVHWDGAGPVFDRDDEVYAPTVINIDGVADNAVVASVWVTMTGEVQELD